MSSITSFSGTLVYRLLMSKLANAFEFSMFRLDNLFTNSFDDDTLYLSCKQLFICFSNHLAKLYSGVFMADNTGLTG